MTDTALEKSTPNGANGTGHGNNVPGDEVNANNPVKPSKKPENTKLFLPLKISPVDLERLTFDKQAL